MVTGEAEVWPGVGIHSTCADVTESIPLSFLYDAGTDGRLIYLNLQSHNQKPKSNEDLHSAKRGLTSSEFPFLVSLYKSFLRLCKFAIVCGIV